MSNTTKTWIQTHDLLKQGTVSQPFNHISKSEGEGRRLSTALCVGDSVQEICTDVGQNEGADSI